MSQGIRIGGASGYWGDSDMAVPQFLKEGGIDYVVFDYLAEITMSIMARQRAKGPGAGYARDFVTGVLAPNLAAVAKQGVKMLSNAGGVNPRACGEEARKLVSEQGLDLKVAVVEGDDLLANAGSFSDQREMYSNARFPAVEKLASINAYLGAFPVAKALSEGADIVITGRCVDSALTLAACIHAFGWEREQFDLMAAGSLCGHILECGAQATGGNFTDWKDVAETLWNIGYPIAEVQQDGAFEITKPVDTGGKISIGTVGEQMLYEIGDPQAYMLPDVVCDFSNVRIKQVGDDRVRINGAVGRPAPDRYKVCATYEDGWRAGAVWFYYGEAASARARCFGDNALRRAREKLCAVNAPDFEETLVEIIGDESLYGAEGRREDARDVALKVAVKHRDRRGAGTILKEMTGQGLAGPPGLSGFAGSRPQPSPVVRLFSFLMPKKAAAIRLTVEGREIPLEPEQGEAFDSARIERHSGPVIDADTGPMTEVPLVKLAFVRSGDKGDMANIGVLPRAQEYAPWIWSALTTERVAKRFAHYLNGGVERFYMPGAGAINFVLHEVLGGGGMASLRNDPQAKGYSQILLREMIPLPSNLAESL